MKFLAVFAALAAVAVGYPTTTWTLNDLSEVLQNPQTNPALIPYLEAALNEMIEAIFAGHDMQTITIAMPQIASYTLDELVSIIQDPNTNPAHLHYYEAALNELMTALYSGHDQQFVTVVIPPTVGEIPVDVAEIKPTPVEVVEGPKPVEAAPSASSPLVQIIVNVKQQQQNEYQEPGQFPVYVDEGVYQEYEPTPVQVVDNADIPIVKPVLPPLAIHPRN